jgi:[protein-PII] uridylyltransferase
VDAAITRLYTGRLCVVAVGGYGRGELSPHSDIDLLLLHARQGEEAPGGPRALLYPLWDAGFRVGHALATPKGALERAERDLDAATALLSARLVAGPPEPYEELSDRLRRWLQRSGRGLARRILDGVAERHRRVERAGWSLAPDIKEDAGGLRDLHVLHWLGVIAGQPPSDEAQAAGDLLLDVREALHGCSKRKGDRLLLELQPEVARRLGLADADALMGPVHRVCRSLEHAAAIERELRAQALLGGPRRSGLVERLPGGALLADGRVSAPEARDLASALRVLAAVSASGKRPDLATLAALRAAFATAAPEALSAPEQQAFLAVLEGPAVQTALELMDQLDGFSAVLPAFTAVRALAQHDPYHRYTVDAHSFLCVAEVNRLLAGDVGRALTPGVDPTVLRLGALLHDVGKAAEGDHCAAGEGVARAAALRLGLSRDDAGDVGLLVKLHLLLPDTATRRDLDDGAVIEQVAKAVGEPRLLEMLYLLAVADGRATGPNAWSSWKATLLHELFGKVLVTLQTGTLPPRSDVAARAREVESFEPTLSGRAAGLLATLPPSYLSSTPIDDMADELKLLLDPPGPGEVRCFISDDDGELAGVTVCVADRPGTLARSAGVLTLNGLSVLRAQAYSTTTGLAIERFVVETPAGLEHARLVADLAAAYSGRLALEARLGRKVAAYAPNGVEIDVRFLPEASAHSTVLEVRGPDVLGLLYALCSALAELDIDIHVAKIDTLAERVVDVFYVRNPWGEPLTGEQMAEVERALHHRVQRLFGR